MRVQELSRNTDIKIGSERSFGLIFTVVFLAIALFPLAGGEGVRTWAVAIAVAFALAAVAVPDLLRPLNRLWFRLGLVLNAIISPVVMAIIFFLTVTPIGLIRRAWDTDPLKQEFDLDAVSYWIEVAPDHMARSSMQKQF